MADQSPGVEFVGVKGFEEIKPADPRANQGDSDVLRLKGKVGPRDIDVPQDDPEREMWQFGDVQRLDSKYLPK
jgi:hypothetical protein